MILTNSTITSANKEMNKSPRHIILVCFKVKSKMGAKISNWLLNCRINLSHSNLENNRYLQISAMKVTILNKFSRKENQVSQRPN